MSNQNKVKYKIDFAGESEQGENCSYNNDHFVKFPQEHANLSTLKGQMFIVTDAKTKNPNGEDVGEMAIRIIKENYFSYPSEDIGFSLSRAFDTANRQIYQYAHANNLHRRVGTTCTTLVLVDRFAYIAHVGDCRVYRISVRKIEQLSHDHVQFVPVSPENKKSHSRKQKCVLTRALGVKLGVKIDTLSKVPLHRDEYFLLCSDGLNTIDKDEIKHIVLSSSPQFAVKKLIDLARAKGVRDNITVQVIKVYNPFPEAKEKNSRLKVYSFDNRLKLNNWPAYLMLGLLMSILLLVIRDTITNDWPDFLQKAIDKYGISNFREIQNTALIESNSKQLLNAQKYLANGKVGRALGIYQNILEHDKENHEARSGVEKVVSVYKDNGDKYLDKKNWVRALKFYEKAKKLRPDDEALRNRVVECQYHIHRQQSLKISEANGIGLGNTVPQIVPYPNQFSLQNKTFSGFNEAEWDILQLKSDQDFRMEGDKTTLLANHNIKRIFHRATLDSVSIEVQVKIPSQAPQGRFGLILGHQWQQKKQYKKYYIFSVDNNLQYTFQKISKDRVKILASGYIQPAITGNSKQTHLKAKCLNRLLLLYANGELLNMLTLGHIHGGTGLYADADLEVEFSSFKISPAELK